MWQDFKDFLEDVWPLLLTLTLAIVAIAAIVITASTVRTNGERRCHEQYGAEWKYTSRSATDCINTKTGEGKFLKD